MSFAREIRSKIGSVNNTRKITRAMEMVAASKMRKAQDRMAASKPYALKIRDVISHLASSHSEYHHPYFIPRALKKVGFIIITTDRGLCGALNSNLLKLVFNTLKNYEQSHITSELCLIGDKGQAIFNRVGGNVVAHAGHLGDTPAVANLIGVIKVMLEHFKEGKVDAIFVAHNEFVNTMVQQPTIFQLIPLLPSEKAELKHHWDYIYEPDATLVLDILLTRYIESQVYQAVTENMACEQAARTVAMKNATENAGELIDSLQLAYNKARQAAITQELSEIVAGAEAV